jgi:hypothetical protein
MRRTPADFRTWVRRWQGHEPFAQALRQWLAAEEEGTPVPFRLDEVHHQVIPLEEPDPAALEDPEFLARTERE